MAGCRGQAPSVSVHQRRVGTEDLGEDAPGLGWNAGYLHAKARQLSLLHHILQGQRPRIVDAAKLREIDDQSLR